MFIVVVPVAAPMFKVVAAPAKFTVVAPAFISANVAELVVREVRKSGDVANTNLPVPVSSEITPANCAEVVAANTLRLLAV